MVTDFWTYTPSVCLTVLGFKIYSMRQSLYQKVPTRQAFLTSSIRQVECYCSLFVVVCLLLFVCCCCLFVVVF